MPDASWYEIVDGESLEQGDILKDCPVLIPLESAPEKEEAADEGEGTGDGEPETSLAVGEEILDVAVMTQSCDLLQGNVEDVLVAQVIEWDAWVTASLEAGRDLGTKAQLKWREKLVRGEFPQLSLLQAHDEDPVLGWSMVDFRKLYTVRKELLEQHASQAGSRLRLVPPYREHLSQAFARYFMRVGLPHAASAFKEYPPVAAA